MGGAKWTICAISRDEVDDVAGASVMGGFVCCGWYSEFYMLS